MSSGAEIKISNGTVGSQGSLEQMNSENAAIQNEQKVSAPLNVPIHKHGDLRYSKKKTEEYLLNKSHPKGGANAKFMEDMLGYTKADSRYFHKAIVESIIEKTPAKTQHTDYGFEHTFYTSIKGKNGTYHSANVVVVIQKDNNRTTYKIITVYPDRKD